MSSKVRITVDSLGYGHIAIDDHNMSGAVRGFRVRSEVEERLTIELDLSVSQVEITSLGDRETVFLVNLSDDVISALLAIGWTPPADDNRIYRVARPLWTPDMSVDCNTRPPGEVDDIDNASPDAND